VESHGPLGTLWVGLALGAFYIALIWVNTLLGFLLTPLFFIPQTWLMDWLARRRAQRRESQSERERRR
jgi:membrane protein implicated in regulation of membrane protease activity